MAYDPTIPSLTVWDHAAAFFLLLVVVAAVSLLGSRLGYLKLSPTRRAIKAAVERQLIRKSPGSVRIPKSARDDLDGYRSAIRRSFRESGAADDPTTFRRAFREGRDAVLERVRPIADGLPPAARRSLGFAAWVGVFGLLAVSTDVLVDALAGGRGLPPVEVMLRLAVSEPPKAVALAHEWVALAPIVGTILTLAYAYGVLFYDWLYSAWYVPATLLAALAAGIYTLERRSTSVSDALVELGVHRRPSSSPRRVAALVAAMSSVGVLTVLVAIGAGRRLGSPETGLEFGATVVLVAALALSVVAVGLVALRLRSLRRDVVAARRRGETLRFGLELVATIVVAVTAPLVPVWTLVGLSKIPVVVGAWLGSPFEVKVVTLALGILVVAALVLLARETVSGVWAAAFELAQRRAFRIRAVGAGMPLSVVVAVWVLVGSVWPRRPLLAALIAVSAGLVARGLWFLYIRLRTRLSNLPDAPKDAPTVVVHAYDLDLPDGSTTYYARVNAHPVAAPTLDEAVDAVVERAGAAFADAEAPPSVYARHAEFLRDDGVFNLERTRARLRADCRRRLEGWSDELDAVDVERALREGTTKGGRTPFSKRDDREGPVAVDASSDVSEHPGFPNEIVDDVVESSLGGGLSGVKAADGRVVGLERPPSTSSSRSRVSTTD